MRRVVIAALLVLTLSPAHAQLTDPILLPGTTYTLAAGAGNQTDPHVDGSRVVYTHATGAGSTRHNKIHIVDLITGVTTVPGQVDDFLYNLPDISGDYVVFTRESRTSADRAIAFVNLSDPSLTITELAPAAGMRRAQAAVAGDTVAFQQQLSGFSYTNMCVASLSNPLAPAQCLTDDADLYNLRPNLSPDGNTLVFQKCTVPFAGCDIYAVQRDAFGAWGTPVAITSDGGDELFPATNGTVVVYASNATGDFDLYYAPVTGAGTATRLELTDVPGSHETDPTLSGNLITMRRTLTADTNADLYVFDLARNQLFQLPPTPDIDEKLSDIAVDADGTVHVVWAAIDPLQPDDGDNVYGFSLAPNRASYGVCALFDTSKSFKAGRVVPVRIQLCGANGANLSSPDLVLTATGLVHHDSTASSVLAPDSAGEANADGVFRYDETLEGYVFNLATTGLASGTWELQFRVSGEAYTYGIRFDIK